MRQTTSDDAEFSSSANKTEGVIDGAKVAHHPIPLLGSGCVYSCVEDMIKYARFYMNDGNADGRQIVPRSALDHMYHSRFENKGYGLYIAPAHNSFLVGSSGGGFGYGSNVMWFPEYRVGCVMMGNKPGEYYSPSQFILESYITSFGLPKKPSPLSFDLSLLANPPSESRTDVLARTMASLPSMFQPDWQQYCGDYWVKWGGMEPTGEGKPWVVSIGRRDDALWIGGVFGESQLRQYRPGLFLTREGEALDLRKEPFTYRNIRIQSVG